MNKLLAAGAVIVMIASGCTSLGKPPSPKVVYDFGPPAERLADAAAPAGVALEVRAPAWIDTSRIAYRLAYLDAAERREYAESRWAGAAGALLGERLRQRLGVAAGAGRCVLRLNVSEFAQVFEAPEKSAGVLRLEAQLVDPRGRTVGHFAFGGEAPASTADARGGVAALRAAVDRSSTVLNEWLARSETKGALAGCAG